MAYGHQRVDRDTYHAALRRPSRSGPISALDDRQNILQRTGLPASFMCREETFIALRKST